MEHQVSSSELSPEASAGDPIKVVLDNGSDTTKAGLAGDSTPKVICRTVVGRPRRKGLKVFKNQGNFVGKEALSKRGILALSSPIDQGHIVNWDDMETIWHHIFDKELSISPDEHPLLLTESPLNPKADGEKMAQIMFETFNIPALYVANSAVLSLFADGRTTGTVLKSGRSVTHAVPIVDGSVITDAITRTEVAGRDVTDYLMSLLNNRGYSFTTEADRLVADDIKEKLCYVALDLNQELHSAAEFSTLHKSYTLSDGSVMNLSDERCRCIELMFDPSLLGYVTEGLSQMVHNAISRCKEETWKSLYNNIVLAGGATLYKGLHDRLRAEIVTLAPAEMKVKVIAPEDRKYSAWLGGSILANLPSFKDKWVSKQEYDEVGPSIVNRK
ncbi:actin, clone 302 [Aplysia californica]|uniref:Actin, clone 302 n=1 Tax=Aplysia californica TaxID=6500 RepID=A0ABM0K6L4_APLCA|nr:actin, clone 302 [Aplysia californica]